MSTVKILNPIPGTNGYTTRRHADEFVQRGIAEYTRPGYLRFTSEDRQALNAVIRNEAVRRTSEQPSIDKRFYDWRGGIPAWRGKHYYRPGEVIS